MSKESDQEFMIVAKRASGVADKIGNGGKAPSMDFTLVQMMALTVRNRDLRPPTFLQHPDHLPEGNDLRVLMINKADKDATLRSDAREWAAINRTEYMRAAVGLRNAISAIRMADDLLNDPDNDEVLYEWKNEIAEYIRVTFSVDILSAPFDRRGLETWCELQCARANPVPAWLENWRPDQKMELEPSNSKKIAGTVRYAEGDDDGDTR